MSPKVMMLRVNNGVSPMGIKWVGEHSDGYQMGEGHSNHDPNGGMIGVNDSDKYES